MLGGDIPIWVHVNTFLFRERSLTSVEPTQLALHNLTRTHTRSLCRRAKFMCKTSFIIRRVNKHERNLEMPRCSTLQSNESFMQMT